MLLTKTETKKVWSQIHLNTCLETNNISFE